METLREATVADIAAQSLGAVRVFERLGIDYCCGGKRKFAEACLERGYSPSVVESELTSAAQAAPSPARDWNTAPLTDLVDHILHAHHEYLRRELPVLEARLEKVYRIYNEKYGPTLTGLPEVLGALHAELESHLMKEETILFPAIAAYEAGQRPQACFASVAYPIRVMESEHDGAGEALARIRQITSDYTVPDYGCNTYRALMAGLAELEQDLHMHIHLENNILFPRAIALEASRTALPQV